MRKFIYPYRNGSRSVRAVADAIGARIIRRENSRFRGGENKLVINWGASSMDEFVKEQIESSMLLNRPEAVALASNKLNFFEHVKDQVSIPEYTTSKEEAQSWVEKGKIVFIRENLNGNSGVGIKIIEDIKSWEEYYHPRARMYVLYIPKKHEYRVHVINGEAVEVQRKAMRADMPREMVNFRIRNHQNGFIFAKNEDHEAPQQVLDESIKAVKACGLHFGAVDVVYNEYRERAYVIEVNTAPGLEGSTIDKYQEAFNKEKNWWSAEFNNLVAEAKVVMEEGLPYPEPFQEVEAIAEEIF